MGAVTSAYVIPLSSVTLADVERVGGKNASLGEMLQTLGGQGVRVPQGFVLTADAFRLHLREAGLTEWIERTLAKVDIRDVRAVAEAGQAIRDRVREAPLPPVLVPAVASAYAELSGRYGETATDVAVRSSATAEDLPGASFAGQHETYLNVRGLPALDAAIDGILAALFALLVVLLIANAALVCLRAIRSREPLPTTEAPYVKSRIVAPAGLFPTEAEKQELDRVGAGAGDRA